MKSSMIYLFINFFWFYWKLSEFSVVYGERVDFGTKIWISAGFQ
jgi:hypothetical protein